MRLRWWAQCLAALIILGFMVGTFFGTRKSDVQAQDFGAYYRAGQAVIAGTSPYVIDSHGPLGAYMYAPVFAHTFFRVLAHLPYLWAVRVFMLINWIATILCVRLCLQFFKAPGRDLFWLGLIALVPMGDYLKANLHNGQVGTILTLACVAWLCWTRSGRSFIGGLILSIAIALKLYPALLLPYFLLRRDWRGLIGVALGGMLLFVIPGFFVGFHQIIPLHQEWLKFCFSTQSSDQTLRTGNQSLLGVLARLPLIANGVQTVLFPDRLAILLRIYPAIVLAITTSLYGCLFVSNRNAVRDVAVLLLWMTIASPRAWTFNFAAEILAAMFLAAAILDRHPKSWLAIAALVCVPTAIAFPTNSLTFSDHWSLGAYLLQNKHFDACVILAIAVAIVGRTQKRSKPEESLPASSALKNSAI